MYLSLTCHQIFLLTRFCDIPFSLDLSWSLKLSLYIQNFMTIKTLSSSEIVFLLKEWLGGLQTKSAECLHN